ncbi:MAG: hypothetical protein IPN91_12950 [Holophagaceae bacterium]|uniref:Uncharacterized protein n=1 Tax=Candidatus Geothrix odensensis TaxID=2954440 RepID=A0A936F491_9BACT|nr:hypothetical protein [Candidatus Geothrix odensensis]
MTEHTEHTAEHAEHAGYGTFIKIWVILVVLTGCLVGVSHLGQTAAVWGLLTLTPLKAGLVFYYHAPEVRGAVVQGRGPGDPGHAPDLLRPVVL